MSIAAVFIRDRGTRRVGPDLGTVGIVRASDIAPHPRIDDMTQLLTSKFVV